MFTGTPKTGFTLLSLFLLVSTVSCLNRVVFLLVGKPNLVCRKIRTSIDNYDQAYIAWFTSTRGLEDNWTRPRLPCTIVNGREATPHPQLKAKWPKVLRLACATTSTRIMHWNWASTSWQRAQQAVAKAKPCPRALNVLLSACTMRSACAILQSKLCKVRSTLQRFRLFRKGAKH